MGAALTFFLIAILLSSEVIAVGNPTAGTRSFAFEQESQPSSGKKSENASSVEFDHLRTEGFNAVYSLDYKTARERFLQMTRVAPDHPAGYVYLANNVWLETLYQNRRLNTSVYTGGSFYAQEKDAEDKFDAKRDREFNDFIRQALAATKARLTKNPKDVEAIYYNGSALGIRAAYATSVKRSFARSIADASI